MVYKIIYYQGGHYDYDYPSLIGVKNLKILRKVGDPRPGGPLGTLYNRFRA